MIYKQFFNLPTVQQTLFALDTLQRFLGKPLNFQRLFQTQKVGEK